MTLSVRLDENTRHKLQKTAEALRITRTEVVRRSLQEYCERSLKEIEQSPYDLIRDLAGAGSSGKGDLSTQGEEILRERFGREK
ncbi:MAG: ribbon-helix-helix protein, CopG family [Desulfohalobiaceae bacterium]